MSKYKKIPEKETVEKQKPKKILSTDELIIKSGIISFYLAGIFFVISILFNSGIVTIFMNQNLYLDIVDILIKTISIILFFLFLSVAVGNVEEINGKIFGWKKLTILIIISLIQSIRNGWVFLFSSLGIIILILYLWLLQESR
ncbi:MAG: hypothetical protein KAX33_00065 [Candidatus Lokiarchaeota archaeon]|nr:hypothetical protein [Candidatus Lokiarchaeota archaeon]MCK4280702.1 hypothetical protein [Candidatus Lokiarchaeota archaeon]